MITSLEKIDFVTGSGDKLRDYTSEFFENVRFSPNGDFYRIETRNNERLLRKDYDLYDNIMIFQPLLFCILCS